MKNLKKKILAVFAAAAIAIGFNFAPVSVSAEAPIPETSAMEEVLDETNDETAEENAQTPPVTNNPAQGEDIPEENETGENNTEGTFQKPTLEEFLAAVQKEAELYGLGDAYVNAIKGLKTAATTKQVTISTVFSAAVALGVIIYIIYSKVKDKALKKEIHELYKLLKGQNDGTNALIDGANETEKTVRSTNAKTTEAKKELDNVQTAISCLISAFLAFSDGHKYSETKKQEVERNCVKALKCIDDGNKGGGNNENNAQ